MNELSESFEKAFEFRVRKMSALDMLRFVVAVPLYQLALFIGGPFFKKEVMFLHLEDAMQRIFSLKSEVVDYPESHDGTGDDALVETATIVPPAAESVPEQGSSE